MTNDELIDEYLATGGADFDPVLARRREQRPMMLPTNMPQPAQTQYESPIVTTPESEWHPDFKALADQARGMAPAPAAARSLSTPSAPALPRMMEATTLAVPPVRRDVELAQHYESSRGPLSDNVLSQFSQGFQNIARPDANRPALPEKAPPPPRNALEELAGQGLVGPAAGDWNRDTQRRDMALASRPSMAQQRADSLARLAAAEAAKNRVSPLDQSRIDANKAKAARDQAEADRAKRRNVPGAGGGGGAVLDDTLPPGLVLTPVQQSRWDLIQTLPPKQRGPRADAFLADLSRGEAKDEVAEGKREIANEKESIEYGKEMRLRGIDILESALTNLERAMPKEGDVAGYGATGGFPAFMLSPQGKELRRRAKELQDTKLRKATGAAAPESEQATFGEIMGMGTFASDADLRAAIKQARERIELERSYIAEMYPNARQASRRPGAAAPAPPPAPAAPAQTTFRVRDPKTGRTGTFQGSLADARRAGLEIAQ